MVESEINRSDIAAEMDRTRATLRAALASATDSDLRRRSAGTRWTNEELLYHMVFGFMVVRALLVLVRVFGRLPPPASKLFAALLNAATRPFHTVNFWGSRMGRLFYNRKRMAKKLDRVIDALQRRLEREHSADLMRVMSYPTRWDPFFKPSMTLADVYRYPAQHFEFHRRQLSVKGS